MSKHCKESFLDRLDIKSIPKKAFSFLKNNKNAVRIPVLCIIGLSSVVVSASAAGITVGYKVNYSGKVIAKVKNGSVIKTAETILSANVSDKDALSKITSPRLSVSLILSDKLDSADTVAKKMIDNTDEIVKVSDLVVDGKTVLCYESEEILDIMKSRLESFYLPGAENSSSFVKTVELKDGYRLKSDISSRQEVEDAVNSLDVKTFSTKVTDVSVPFDSKRVKSSEQPLGYIEVTTQGRNGTERKTENFETLNGAQTAYNLVSSEVVAAPVTEIVTEGTAKVNLTVGERSKVNSAGFICPLPKGFRVSAYWGDGRGHKGVDLAINAGTSIFAVASGKVEFAGWDGAYGYCVVIDHGNGLKTRYAHASALYVSAKQKVSQGDVIAAVGMTGSATGHHLHFEVIVNNNRVNPAPYIGL